MKIAFQMDPIGAVDINADSSFRLAEEAQARGHSLFFYTPDHLAFQEGRITARGHDLVVQRVQGDHAKLGPLKRWIWPILMWSGCVRIHHLICTTSRPHTCSTGWRRARWL